jgi:hypothetical protein
VVGERNGVLFHDYVRVVEKGEHDVNIGSEGQVFPVRRVCGLGLKKE